MFHSPTNKTSCPSPLIGTGSISEIRASIGRWIRFIAVGNNHSDTRKALFESSTTQFYQPPSFGIDSRTKGIYYIVFTRRVSIPCNMHDWRKMQNKPVALLQKRGYRESFSRQTRHSTVRVKRRVGTYCNFKSISRYRSMSNQISLEYVPTRRNYLPLNVHPQRF